MKKAILIVTASIGLGAMANAQATSMQFISMDRSDALTGSITVSGTTKSVYLGAIKFKEGSNFLTTYCVDPLNALNGSNNPYDKSILNTGDGTGLGLAGKILAANFTSAKTANEQAALQLAIWSALEDNGTSFNASGTNFKANNFSTTVLGLASTYYTKGFTTTPTAQVNFYKAGGAGGQSQIQVVPEPATMAMLGLGALGMLRRRKVAKK